MANYQDQISLDAQRNRQDIVKAKLTRRDMIQAGLLTTGGSLILKQGLSARAFAKGDDDKLTTATRVVFPPSPPTIPWRQEMTRLPVKTAIAPSAMKRGGRPDGTTLIDGASKRVKHQLCSYQADDTYGGLFPPKKFYELSMRESAIRVHPDYGTTTVWGFDGIVPGPVIKATYGEPIMVRFYNDLPSVKRPQAFGIAEMSTHLHNNHTPTESDGNPLDYFNSVNDPCPLNPLGFKDQHYPNVYAGYQAYGTGGDSREAMGSLWFHDHHLDFTAQNVYKGMFGCYLLYDHKDTGDETTGLRLPSGKYDIPIFFNDFLFDKDCQLVFDLFNLDGILGDKYCANGAIQPVMSVDKRRYRLRLYNPGPSRWYEFAFWDGDKYLPFWQISTDGNLLPEAVQVSSARLSVAERVDIIVDFSKTSAKRLYLVNRLEQVNGRGPTGRVLNPGTPIVQINIGAAAPDFSRDPATGPFPLRPLPDIDFAALLARADKAPKRTWKFDRGNGAWQVNGKLFDDKRVSAKIDQESEEVWIIRNESGGWRHPIHIHFEEHRVLSRDGVPIKPNKSVNGTIDYARRDVVPLNENNEVQIFMRFRDMKGRYVMHCHNVVHEDHAMMVRFDIV